MWSLLLHFNHLIFMCCVCLCGSLTPTCNDRRGSRFHQRNFFISFFSFCLVLFLIFDCPPGLFPDHKINNILYSLGATVHHMLDQLETELDDFTILSLSGYFDEPVFDGLDGVS